LIQIETIFLTIEERKADVTPTIHSLSAIDSSGELIRSPTSTGGAAENEGENNVKPALRKAASFVRSVMGIERQLLLGNSPIAGKPREG
jgi:hypothetical protein